MSYQLDFVKPCMIPVGIMNVLERVGEARLDPSSPIMHTGVTFKEGTLGSKDTAVVVTFLYRAEAINELSPIKSPFLNNIVLHNNVGSLKKLSLKYKSKVDSILDLEGEG